MLVTEDKGFEPLHEQNPSNGFRDRPLQPDLGNLPKSVLNYTLKYDQKQ